MSAMDTEMLVVGEEGKLFVVPDDVRVTVGKKMVWELDGTGAKMLKSACKEPKSTAWGWSSDAKTPKSQVMRLNYLTVLRVNGKLFPFLMTKDTEPVQDTRVLIPLDLGWIMDKMKPDGSWMVEVKKCVESGQRPDGKAASPALKEHWGRLVDLEFSKAVWTADLCSKWEEFESGDEEIKTPVPAPPPPEVEDDDEEEEEEDEEDEDDAAEKAAQKNGEEEEEEEEDEEDEEEEPEAAPAPAKKSSKAKASKKAAAPAAAPDAAEQMAVDDTAESDDTAPAGAAVQGAAVQGTTFYRGKRIVLRQGKGTFEVAGNTIIGPPGKPIKCTKETALKLRNKGQDICLRLIHWDNLTLCSGVDVKGHDAKMICLSFEYTDDERCNNNPANGKPGYHVLWHAHKGCIAANMNRFREEAAAAGKTAQDCPALDWSPSWIPTGGQLNPLPSGMTAVKDVHVPPAKTKEDSAAAASGAGSSSLVPVQQDDDEEVEHQAKKPRLVVETVINLPDLKDGQEGFFQVVVPAGHHWNRVEYRFDEAAGAYKFMYWKA